MRLISLNESSGRAEMSKFSLARAAVFGVVSTAVPRCTAVVDDIAVLIPWVLLGPWLKCKRSVNEVKIQIPKPESIQTGLKGWFNPLGPMIGILQLCGNENV